MTPNHGSVGAPTRDPIHNIFDIYTLSGLRPSTTYTLNVLAMSHNVLGWEPVNITFTTSKSNRRHIHHKQKCLSSHSLQVSVLVA